MIDDDEPVRLAARHAELFLVHLPEELALVELDRPLEIAASFGPGDIEHLHLDPACWIKAGNEPGEPAPASLKAAQARVVEDRIELRLEQHIQRSDVAIERRAAGFRI